jgi:hypothetical protein
MIRYLIVEGITDVAFVKYICLKNEITNKFNDFKKLEEQDTEIEIYNYNNLYILNTKSQDKLKYVLKNIIKPFEIKIDRIAILQDTDNNYDKSFKDIINAIEESQINKDLIPNENIFLTPNNNKDDEGDLETLLLSTLDKENIPQLKCFQDYKSCLDKNINIETKYMDKGELYAYTMFAKEGKDNFTPHNSFMYKKSNGKYQDTELWNLEKEEFKPIIEFILKVFK